MKAILSGERRTLVCLVFCMAGPLTAGPSPDLLGDARDSAVTAALVAPPPISLRPSAEAQIEEELRLAEARQVQEEERRRMSFFEAIAGND